MKITREHALWLLPPVTGYAALHTPGSLGWGAAAFAFAATSVLPWAGTRIDLTDAMRALQAAMPAPDIATRTATPDAVRPAAQAVRGPVEAVA